MIKIAIISTLKPTTEVRIYKRFAKSLSKTNKYEINIIGLPEKFIVENDKNIKHHFLNIPGRGTLNRLKSWKSIRNHLKEINPNIIIITAPDQIIPILFLSKKLSFKIVYDIQEDYWINIINQRIYPFPFNLIYAVVIRLLERATKPMISHYILAEKIYSSTIPFVKNKFTILENRVAFDVNTIPDISSKNTLIFTGIISNYSGIESAIELYKKLSVEIPSLALKIVGYAPLKQHVNYLQKEAEKDNNITLIGIDTFVPHATILTEIRKANLGIVAYENNDALIGKIPTKLFEYTYFGLPYLIHHQSYILKDANQMGGAIPVDFTRPDLEVIANMLQNNQEKPTINSSHPSSWSHEESKLIKLINSLTN